MKTLHKYLFVASVVIVSCFLSISGISCKKTASNFIPRNDTITGGGIITASDTNTKRILSLGDSYTIGQGVTESERFPNLTVKWLQMRGVKMQYPSRIIAQTGWTTANLLNGINTATPVLAGTYDLVTLLIGVNNQFQRRDIDEYRTQFIECLNSAIGFSGNRKNRVFVLSIPDWGATPFGQNSNPVQVGIDIDRFNAINKEVCMQMGVSYTNITPITRQVIVDATLLAADGLHYSGKTHALWAAMIGEKMLPLVR